MSKTLKTAEFEVNASPKLIFPYISTATGLSEWFADDVTVSDKTFHFLWDGEDHPCTLVSQKVNKFVRFEFPDDGSDDVPYMELSLEVNELTQTLYLTIQDYSDSEETEEEFFEMWEDLVETLKEVVGA